jgi:hypothetical protein
VVQRRLRLDLRDHRHPAAQRRDVGPGGVHVLDGADEGQPDIIHSLLQAEAEVVQILLTEDREAGEPRRDVDALTGAQTAAADDATIDLHLRHALDTELDGSVGEEQRVARFDLARQGRVRHRHPAGGALDRNRREDERVTGFERDAPAGDGADAHLGSGEILEHADGDSQPFGEVAGPIVHTIFVWRFRVPLFTGKRYAR